MESLKIFLIGCIIIVTAIMAIYLIGNRQTKH